MFYFLNDTHKKHLKPTLKLMEDQLYWLSQPIFSNVFPLTSKYMSAILEFQKRLMQEYPKPEFGIKEIYIDSIPFIVEEKIVLQKPFCNLIQFKRELKPGEKSHSIFIVAPLSGHYATLLRDTVRGFLQNSNEVYITEWINARDVPLSEGEFHLSTYVEYLIEFLNFKPKSHVVAVCQPVVPVLIASSIMHKDENRPQSMTLIGGPIDARKHPTAVDEYATQHSLNWFKRHAIDIVPYGYKGVGRKVYPGYLQHFGFVSMNPQRHKKAYFEFFNDLIEGDNSSAQKHREFYNEYNAVLDMDSAFYLETLDEVFQKFSLAKGTMEMLGQKIKPELINDIGLFTIEGEKDDIAGIGQTKAAHHLCKNIPQNLKKHWLVPSVGHYGVFSGNTFRNKIVPEIINWQKSIK